MVDSDPIGDAMDNFVELIIAAFENIMGLFGAKIGDFLGNFIGGDLTSNSPALLALALIMISTGGILAYKISRG